MNLADAIARRQLLQDQVAHIDEVLNYVTKLEEGTVLSPVTTTRAAQPAAAECIRTALVELRARVTRDILRLENSNVRTPQPATTKRVSPPAAKAKRGARVASKRGAPKEAAHRGRRSRDQRVRDVAEE